MKTKSIWGIPPKRLYKLINLAEERYDSDFKSCIVGCSDGKFLIPFARKGHFVKGYDIDDVALFGGKKVFPIVPRKIIQQYSKDFISEDYELKEEEVMGICKRLKKENLSGNAIIEKRDFYKNVPDEKFDVVFTSCSLHYSVNKEFTLKDKIKKLQSIVSKNGLLYIDYMMAIDENDYENYPKTKFFRKGEITNYFDDDWHIISLVENNRPNFEGAHVDCVKDHFHRWGYILAEKIK